MHINRFFAGILAVAIGLATQISCGKYIAPLFISDEEEIQMGKNFDAEIRTGGEYVVSANAVLNGYVDSIGQHLAARQTQRRYEGGMFPFHFAVIVDPDINAFAVPGGYVYVHTGLLKSMATEEELAGVIAHEIAHVTNAHGRELMVKEYGVDFLKQIVGFDSSIVVEALQGLAFLNYSRINENEADSCGVEFMHLTDWNPKGMAEFFQVLINKYGDNSSLPWLSTHPVTSDRKDNVERIALRYPADALRPTIPIPAAIKAALPR